MLVALLAAPLAQADVALEAPCYEGVGTTVPANDATGVPVDIAPAVVLEGCGTFTGPITVTVLEAESGTTVFTDDFTVDTSTWTGTATLDLPQQALTPDTTYNLLVESDLFGPDGIAFTTGDRTTTPGDAEGLSVTVTDPFGWRSNGGFVANVSGEIAGANGQLVRIVSRADPDVTATITPPVTSFWFQTVVPDEEVCVFAERRDEQGTWHASEDACAPLEVVRDPNRACSATGTAGLLLAPLPLLLVRRRRSR